MRRRGRPRHPDILTPREWEVLALIREGLSNPEIAARLGIGREGVKYHVSEILSKLGAASREEAARWRPEKERPSWGMALAPLAFLGRKAGWVPAALAGGVGTALLVGLALVVWGVTQPGGDGAAEPSSSALVGDLLGCYREPPSGAGLAATRSLQGASVSVSGKDLATKEADRLLSLLGGVEPAYFGVRGAPGTKISEPGRLAETTIHIDLGSGGLSLKYVRPGPVAPYGLLFDPALINAWEFTMLIDPPGYAQSVCTVPPEFDQIMAELGFNGYDPVDILETRLVLAAEAQRDFALVEQIQVWREGEPRRGLSLATVQALGIPVRWNDLTNPPTEETETRPLEPFAGEPLSVGVRFTGIDPFPEAMQPAEFRYYPDDASASGRGVLVPLTGIAISNGVFRPGEAFFPGPELDQLLRQAASPGAE